MVQSAGRCRSRARPRSRTVNLFTITLRRSPALQLQHTSNRSLSPHRFPGLGVVEESRDREKVQLSVEGPPKADKHLAGELDSVTADVRGTIQLHHRAAAGGLRRQMLRDRRDAWIRKLSLPTSGSPTIGSREASNASSWISIPWPAPLQRLVHCRDGSVLAQPGARSVPALA